MDDQQEAVEEEPRERRERVLMFSTTFTSGVPGYLIEKKDGII
jgi:hypothetical protein